MIGDAGTVTSQVAKICLL